MDIKYEYTVKWSEEDQEYIGTCRQFPLLVGMGETPVIALKEIMEIVRIAWAIMTDAERDAHNKCWFEVS